MNLAQENDSVLLVGKDGKRSLFVLKSGWRHNTHHGFVEHNDIIGQSFGRSVTTHLGHKVLVLRPSLDDLLMNLKRGSQIIYPKDIGLILLKMNLGAGSRVIEAGTGSGALTTAFAHRVAPTGTVYSYGNREDMINIARKNLELAGYNGRVEFHQRDIIEGFDQTGVDAVFLDVREPWEYLSQVTAALQPSGFFGALVPTTNQVTELLFGIRGTGLWDVEVLEILVRHYKPVPARLRPVDLMPAHTGYLVFARYVPSDAVDSEDVEELDSSEEGVYENGSQG